MSIYIKSSEEAIPLSGCYGLMENKTTVQLKDSDYIILGDKRARLSSYDFIGPQSTDRSGWRILSTPETPETIYNLFDGNPKTYECFSEGTILTINKITLSEVDVFAVDLISISLINNLPIFSFSISGYPKIGSKTVLYDSVHNLNGNSVINIKIPVNLRNEYYSYRFEFKLQTPKICEIKLYRKAD